MASFAPSVRLALASEAGDIAAIQRDCYNADPVMHRFAITMNPDEMTQAWAEAIASPPLATYRVLVALDDQRHPVGFAAIGPADDPDAQPTDGLVAEFCVRPAHLHNGHTDRLMHAAVDTLRADGFTRATWWIRTTDDLLRCLLTESGWAADGAHQEIGDDDETIRIKQIRMHTAL